MTFTYTVIDTPTDLTKVRYHIGDTESAAAIFTDEEISMVLAMNSAAASPVNAAVLSLILTAKAKLNHEPDMTADWLRIDWRRSAEHWDKLLAEKRREFGLGFVFAGGGSHAYRPDTHQHEEPTYDSDTTDDE